MAGRASSAPNTGSKAVRNSPSLTPMPPGSGSISAEMEITDCSRARSSQLQPRRPKARYTSQGTV